MRFLIVTQYYWPEFFVINKLTQKLFDLGHEVTVITGKPNYPEGKIYEGYSSSGIMTESYGDVEIIRIPLRPRGRGVVNLVLNYLSFVVSGILYIPRILKNRKFDVVLVYAPSPITSAIPAIWLNRKLKAHVAIWVQDLWPQSLKATGYITNKFLLKIIGWLVRWIYDHVDTLLAQSHAFKMKLEEYVNENKVIYYPNSIESQNLSVSQPELPQEIKDTFNLGFNIVFTGNIGNAQSIPTLLETAAKLQDTDCRFIFIGNGSLFEWAKDKVKELGLSNTVFLGRMDNNFMRSIYQLSDALILSLTANEIFSYTIPGKLQAYLAAGRPVIASINGEAGQIIREAGAGLVCTAEDSKLLAQSIREFRSLSQTNRDAMGVAGKDYFNKHFNLDVMALQLVTILKERTGVIQE